jgi:formate hydrogenlyase transcriptional activator
MSIADRGTLPTYSARFFQSIAGRYAMALTAVTLIAFIRHRLDLAFGPAHPLILFWPVVMLAALLEGFWLGLFTTLVSGVFAYYLHVQSWNSFVPANLRDVIGLILFVVIGSSMSAVGDLFWRRARRLQEFQKAVEGLKEMIIVIDRDYRYLIANDAFLEYRGMKREEVIGRHVRQVLTDGLFESSVKEKLDECLAGNTVQYQMRYEYPARGERDLLISYFPIEGKHGIDRVACVLQDTTELRQSEHSLRLFRRLIDASNDSVLVIDPATYCLLDVNERACRDLGYSRAELLSMKMPEFEATGDESDCWTMLETLKSGEPLLVSRLYKRKDGSTYPVEVSLKYVELDRSYVIAVSRDVSERAKAESALRESEDRYRDLVEHSHDLVCTHDLRGKLLSVNAAPSRRLGYEVGELLQMSMRDLIAPEFQDAFDTYLEKIRTNGADEGLLCVITRSGERRIWEYHNTLRTEGVPRPIVRGLAYDVTERWIAEHALRQREEEYRQFVAQSSEGIFRQDLDTPVPIDLPEDELVHHLLHNSYLAECNDAMARMYGLDSRLQIVGKRLTETLTVDDPHIIELTREYIRSGFRVLDRESHETDVHDNSKVFRNSLIGIVKDGMLQQTWGIQRDVTEQVRLEHARAEAESALRKSEQHFRILVEQASDGIFLADAQGRFIDVNTAGAQMLGYSRKEILRSSICDVIAKNDISRIPAEVARFARGAVVLSEWTFRRKDGSCFPGEISGSQLPDGRLQGIVRDVTERKQAEQEMRRSEERFRVALKDSPITVFNQDRDLRYTWLYNPQLSWEHDAVGKTDEDILGVRKAANLTRIKRSVLTTGVAVREEIIVPAEGGRFAFDLSIEPLLDPAGNVVGIAGTAMDIAKLQELADRLQDSRDRLQQEKSYLEKEIRSELGFAEIIGRSPALQEVLKKTRVVAGTDSTVLLLGETGTGKELVARSLHSLSSRHDKTFMKLNCAAVPSGLLESELFGHEKGAFTSASSQKLGRIELADKGTLFLDEIGELPLELQPKLLRVLQDREFERLGGVRTLHVDVRIISATNRDLRQDIAEKKFREDLYYRLNVFPIQLPPLRDRREDIPSLVRHFVDKHAARMGKRVDIISDETMTTLQNWKWPGNIRELENMVERMIILSKGRVLAAPPADLFAVPDAVPDDLNEMERDHIVRVLRETNGILSGSEGAAVRLGLKRTTLQSMLKRFGIEAGEFRRGHSNAEDN